MQHLKLSILGVSLAALGVAAFATMKPASGQDPTLGGPAAQTPVRLVYAQPFVLDQAYEHAWRSDHPVTSAGWLIAVSTDPTVADVRNTHDELLFAGAMPVERINVGGESGVVVGIVPSSLAADGSVALDLSQTPIFWAQPDILPEALTQADAQAVLAAGVAQGVAAQRGEVVERAQAEGGGTIYLGGLGDLFAYAANLVARYSPEEADLVSGLTLEPLIK